jgi:hypothetical protein
MEADSLLPDGYFKLSAHFTMRKTAVIPIAASEILPRGIQLMCGSAYTCSTHNYSILLVILLGKFAHQTPSGLMNERYLKVEMPFTTI